VKVYTSVCSLLQDVEWGSKQPDLAEDVPAHSRGVETRWPLRSLPTLTILWFYGAASICIQVSDAGV